MCHAANRKARSPLRNNMREDVKMTAIPQVASIDVSSMSKKLREVDRLLMVLHLPSEEIDLKLDLLGQPVQLLESRSDVCTRWHSTRVSAFCVPVMP